MNNLCYSIQTDFINDSGVKVTISRTMYDTGLEVNSTQIGDVCIVEETINGRVLSGMFKKGELECGYRYDYDNNSEYLININEEVPLNKAIEYINKTKMKQEFLHLIKQ